MPIVILIALLLASCSSVGSDFESVGVRAAEVGPTSTAAPATAVPTAAPTTPPIEPTPTVTPLPVPTPAPPPTPTALSSTDAGEGADAGEGRAGEGADDGEGSEDETDPQAGPAEGEGPAGDSDTSPGSEPDQAETDQDTDQDAGQDTGPETEAAASNDDEALPPSDYDGEIRALRTAGGHVLTVRSAGPLYEVVTPCFNVVNVTEGLPITGAIDVLIDPGHGGPETGAVSPNGLVEADLNLRVAELLRAQLADLGYSVLQTRYSDHQMAIQARAELTNALQPRIMVSIHHNGGFPTPVERPGTEIFIQNENPDSERLGGILSLIHI